MPAVKIARRFFPSALRARRHAIEPHLGRGISVTNHDEPARADGTRCVLEYAVGAELPEVAPESLSSSLSVTGSTPAHLEAPDVRRFPLNRYPLRRAEVSVRDEICCALMASPRPCVRPTTSSCPGVDVTIFPLERAAGIPDAEGRPAPPAP